MVPTFRTTVVASCCTALLTADLHAGAAPARLGDQSVRDQTLAASSFTLTFLGGPKARHGSVDSRVWLGGDLSIRSTVRLLDGTGPVGSVAVRFFARSSSTGEFATGVVTTAPDGTATGTVVFRGPLQTGTVVTQACVALLTSVCTTPVPIDLNRRFELAGFIAAERLSFPIPSSVGQSSAFIAANTGLTLHGAATLRAHIRRPRSRADVNGETVYVRIPYVHQRRTVEAYAPSFLGPRRHVFSDAAAGIGNVAFGAALVRNGLSVDGAFSTRSLSGDVVARIREVGYGLVALGDGFPSASLSVSYARPYGAPREGRPHLSQWLVAGSTSFAWKRAFEDGTTAQRGPLARVAAGFTLPGDALGNSTLTAWGAMTFQGRTTVGVPGRADPVFPGHFDTAAGVSLTHNAWLKSVRPTLDVSAGGFRTNLSLSVSVTVHVRPVRWGK